MLSSSITVWRSRLIVLIMCTVVAVAALSGGSRGGNLDVHDCLWGTPTAAYFAKAKALARSAGERFLLPTRLPRTPAPQLASFCPGQRSFNFAWGKRPRPDPSIEPQSLLPTKDYVYLRSYAYRAWLPGQPLADVLRRAALSHRKPMTVRLGPYTAYHYGTPTRPCYDTTEWIFRVNNVVYEVYDNGQCGGKLPAPGPLGQLWGRPGGSASFIASLRPAY
jgi:hypothetical protein